MSVVIVVVVVLLVAVVLALGTMKGLIYNCSPNEVLIFSGGRRDENGRTYGYRLIKGGTGLRLPLLEKVDRLELSNMVIDLTATNAYCRGGIPLSVQGVANVKIAGQEPVLDNAIERFLGRTRDDIAAIAKATLEGSLRGILSTLTPEQVNEDKILFAERLVHEVEADMTALGLVVDTLKIQNVHDDVKYLDSIGRRRSAEVVSEARVAEAKAQADSIERQAQNLEREVAAQIAGEIDVARADAQRRLTDALTRRDALVAEERAVVMAQVAQATAEIDVQKARAEQERRRLEADVVQPARAASEAAASAAKADTAGIVEDGLARAEALSTLAATWKAAGASARQVTLSQKLVPLVDAVASTIADTSVSKLTVIGTNPANSSAGAGNGLASLPVQALPILEQMKALFGIDVVERLRKAAPLAVAPGTANGAPAITDDDGSGPS